MAFEGNPHWDFQRQTQSSATAVFSSNASLATSLPSAPSFFHRPAEGLIREVRGSGGLDSMCFGLNTSKDKFVQSCLLFERPPLAKHADAPFCFQKEVSLNLAAPRHTLRLLDC